MTPAHVLGYVALGVAVGAVGTLIGAGGGFVLVQGRWILRTLGAGLFVVGVRLLFPRAM
jgi:hypothetical protein